MARTYRPTWAEIDLDNLIYNLSQIRALADKGTEIMPVVKANAYGHGIIEISRILVSEGVKYLGVATVDEALKIRAAGMDVNILVMGSVLEDEAAAAFADNITLTLCDIRLMDVLEKLAVSSGKKPKVHIKIDTGMGRIGVWHEHAAEFVERAVSGGKIEVEGVYTHFSSAGRDEMYTNLQIDSFRDVIGRIENRGIKIPYRHSANSIASVGWEIPGMNLIRPGILLYGIYPKETFRDIIDLKPVMALKTRVVFLKDTPSGRAISYGRTYITQKDTKIATIPIGYADGYGRILSNRAEALIRGEYVRIVGIVTMDQTLLDVGDVNGIKVGDEVVLFGQQGNAVIPVEKISKTAGTIPYEILACITDRVPRVYKNSL